MEMDVKEVKKMLACNGVIDEGSMATIFSDITKTLTEAGLKCESDLRIDDCFEDLENMNILTISRDTGIVMGHTMHEFTRNRYDGKLMCIEWVIYAKGGKYKACFRNQLLGTVYDIDELNHRYAVRFTSKLVVEFDDIDKAILFAKSNIVEGMIGDAALDTLTTGPASEDFGHYVVADEGLTHHNNEPVDCDDINSQGSIRMPGM